MRHKVWVKLKDGQILGVYSVKKKAIPLQDGETLTAWTIDGDAYTHRLLRTHTLRACSECGTLSYHSLCSNRCMDTHLRHCRPEEFKARRQRQYKQVMTAKKTIREDLAWLYDQETGDSHTYMKGSRGRKRRHVVEYHG